MSTPKKKPNYITYLLDAYKSKAWGILLFNFLIASLSLYGVFSMIRALSANFNQETASRSSQTELEGAPPTPETQESEVATENPSVNPFSEVRFPMESCGDSLPQSDEDYPISFYPVFIDHSEANLEKIASEFCRDSFPQRREGDQLFIQVSSFTDRAKAQDFADFLAETFASAEVGQATVVATNPNSTSAKNSPSPSPTPQPRQARRSSPSRDGFSQMTMNCDTQNRDTQVFEQLEIDCYRIQVARGLSVGKLELNNYGRDWYEVITSQGEILRGTLVDSVPKGDSYILVSPSGSIREDLHKDMSNQIELRVRKMARSQASRSITVKCDDKPLKVWGIHLTPRCSEAGTNIIYVNGARTNVKVDFGGDNPIAFQPVTIITQSGYFRSSSNQMRLTFTPL
jgi:hypothetical protein